MQVSRPDGKPDSLGLKVLDEPAAVQSDPSVLTMQLRQASKQASSLRQQRRHAGLSRHECSCGQGMGAIVPLRHGCNCGQGMVAIAFKAQPG